MQNMNKLLEIMAALRDPQTGCPWDIKQSFKTIVPYTLEEAYEVADSIERGAMSELKDELGDLLFQVVFYAQMGKEQDLFEFSDIVDAINDKLVRRHPHVFADVKFENEQAVHDNWEKSKAAERDQRASTDTASILDGVAHALPALKRAQKLQKRAARVGFDWPEISPVLDKLSEEIEELRQAIQQKDHAAISEEVGDLIFTCVNLARHLDVDAEESLRGCNHKFETRFNKIEQQLKNEKKDIHHCSIDELEALWQKAKAK